MPSLPEDKLAQLEERRTRLTELGFLDADRDLHRPPQKIDESKLDVLSVYVQDIEQKLAVFDDLAQRIRLFMEIVNRRFKYKKLTMSKEHGFVLTSTLQQEPLSVDHEEASAGLRGRKAGIAHGGTDEAGDTAAGRACTKHRHTLLGDRHAGDVDRRQQGAGRHGGRPLDIVVEGAEPVAVALEQARRVVLGEIFPLQQDMRPAPGQRLAGCELRRVQRRGGTISRRTRRS